MMLVHGIPITYPVTQSNESPILINTIKGYLAYCQDQMPEQDIGYILNILSGGQSWAQVTDSEKFNSLAQTWKQMTQSARRRWDENAAKNEPHPGEPGQGGNGAYPRLTPYETEGVLEALTTCNLEWNIKEDSDDDDE